MSSTDPQATCHWNVEHYCAVDVSISCMSQLASDSQEVLDGIAFQAPQHTHDVQSVLLLNSTVAVASLPRAG